MFKFKSLKKEYLRNGYVVVKSNKVLHDPMDKTPVYFSSKDAAKYYVDAYHHNEDGIGILKVKVKSTYKIVL